MIIGSRSHLDSEVDPPLDRLQERLQYTFGDQDLLLQALTHRSKANKNNERLEFLGDSILGFIVAEWLYRNFPDISEGKLSRMRSVIVRRDTLADIARDLDFSAELQLGSGELKSGGFNRESILANTLEALIGAIYLDRGVEECSRFVLRHFGRKLQDLDPDAVYKDPKSKLQEYLQQMGRELPTYEVTNVIGQAHDQRFEVACFVPGKDEPYIGHGSSRRTAEQAAARSAFAALSHK